MTDPLNGVTTFEYDAANRLETRTLPNGVVTTYTYDARDRPLSVVHRNASNVVLVSRTYVRAPGGEPTRITKEDGSYVEIGYDAALRITSERYYTAAAVLEEELAYTYDADGNRLTKTRNGVVSNYSYAAGSRLIGVSTEGELEVRVTDNGGRETSLVVDGQQLSLTYDSDDHVTRVVDGSATTESAFDAAGRRVAVTTASGTRRFLTAPNAGEGFESPQAVTDTTGTVIASYVFAGEMPLAKTTSSGTEYYLTDEVGSVIGTADASGSLLSSVDYDAFGNELDAASVPGGTHGDFRMHGMWKDPSGLYYVHARTYDSTAGRFTSRDPASVVTAVPETTLPYVFANSNPHVYTDPTGRVSMASVSIGITISMGLSAVAVPSLSAYVQRTKGFSRGLAFAAQALDRSGVTEGIAGYGDTATLGLSCLARNALGGGSSVNQNSDSYAIGSNSALIAGIAEGAVAGAAMLGKATVARGGSFLRLRQALGIEEGSFATFHSLTATDKFYYELGNMTLGNEAWNALGGLSKVDIGRKLVAEHGILGAIGQANVLGSMTFNLGSGATPMLGQAITTLVGAALVGGSRLVYSYLQGSGCY